MRRAECSPPSRGKAWGIYRAAPLIAPSPTPLRMESSTPRRRSRLPGTRTVESRWGSIPHRPSRSWPPPSVGPLSSPCSRWRWWPCSASSWAPSSPGGSGGSRSPWTPWRAATFMRVFRSSGTTRSGEWPPASTRWSSGWDAPALGRPKPFGCWRRYRVPSSFTCLVVTTPKFTRPCWPPSSTSPQARPPAFSTPVRARVPFAVARPGSHLGVPLKQRQCCSLRTDVGSQGSRSIRENDSTASLPLFEGASPTRRRSLPSSVVSRRRSRRSSRPSRKRLR